MVVPRNELLRESNEPEEIAGTVTTAFRDVGELLYLVGGAVRDSLLGERRDELDFATSAHPDRTAQILTDLRIGPVYRVGERFGTIGCRLPDRDIEITTFRSEMYTPGSRKPQVRFGRSLLEDLSRRDFTINAMAQDPISGELIDPNDGAADLAAGIIRSVGSAVDRFREDPLRLLRAIRFATRYSFDIEAETWRAMQESAGTVQSISRERIRDEWSKILTGPSPDRGLVLLRDSGLLAASVPELLELTRMPDHGPRHPLSLWDHTMRVVAGVPPLLVLRWAALLHDIAKPATRVHEPDGRPRFFHHEEVGADIARGVLGGLHYSNAEIADVALLVESHMHLHAYTDAWSDGAVRRLTLRLGPLTQPAILLARADASGHTIGNARSANAPKFDHLEERIRVLDRPAEVIRSPLSGDDLMQRYDRPPGPWIRRIKDALLDEVIEGRLESDDRDRALAIADRLVSEV